MRLNGLGPLVIREVDEECSCHIKFGVWAAISLLLCVVATIGLYLGVHSLAAELGKPSTPMHKPL